MMAASSSHRSNSISSSCGSSNLVKFAPSPDSSESTLTNPKFSSFRSSPFPLLNSSSLDEPLLLPLPSRLPTSSQALVSPSYSASLDPIPHETENSSAVLPPRSSLSPSNPQVHSVTSSSHLLPFLRSLRFVSALFCLLGSVATLFTIVIYASSEENGRENVRGERSVGGEAAAEIATGFSSLFAPSHVLSPASSFPSSSFSFLHVGDWGRKGEFNQSRVAQLMHRSSLLFPPSFVLSTGDNFYERGLINDVDETFSLSFTRIYHHESKREREKGGLRNVPWFAILGNHDYYGNSSAQLSPKLKERDHRWNCVRSGRRIVWSNGSTSPSSPPSSRPPSPPPLLEFFFIDTTPLVKQYRSREWERKKGRKVDWSGLKWGERDWKRQEKEQLGELESSLSSSSALFKVVIGHHPIYSAGKHGNTGELIEKVDPLLQMYGVDVYLSGHDHDLQHIESEGSQVRYVVSGGGSKAWKDPPILVSRSAAQIKNISSSPLSPRLLFHWPGQGFGRVRVEVRGEGEKSIMMMWEFFEGFEGKFMHSFRVEKELNEGIKRGSLL